MSSATPLLNLSTTQLQYLLAVHEHETSAQAAEQLQISPSALSQGLSELERKIGLQLFERRGRNRVLTAQGHQAVGHAERVLATTRDLTIWATAAAKGERGRVQLGLIDIAAVYYFPDTLTRFRTERPETDLRLNVGPSAALTARLLSGQLDAAVIVEPPSTPGRSESPEHPELVLSELLNEDLAIYAPGDVRPVGKPRTWGPWVTFPPESHTRMHVARALRELGADFSVEAESHQPEVLRQMVNLGMGWTVLPVQQAETEPNPLIRARRKPLLTRRLVLARRRGATINPATDQLIGRLQAKADQLRHDQPSSGPVTR